MTSEDYITTKEAARQSGFSKEHIQYLCRSGIIPDAHKFGRDWMVPLSALKDYLITPHKVGRKPLDK